VCISHSLVPHAVCEDFSRCNLASPQKWKSRLPRLTDATFFSERQEHFRSKHPPSLSGSIELHPTPSNHRHPVRRHYWHSHSFRAWCENPFKSIFPSLTTLTGATLSNSTSYGSKPVIKARAKAAEQSASQLHEQLHLIQTRRLRTTTRSLDIFRKRLLSGRRRA